MSVTYLLPCHGDNSVEITTAEAGRTIACPCGKKVTVPTLREISRLPKKEAAQANNAPAWSAAQGVLFAVGLVLVAGSVVALAWLGYQRSQLDTAAYIVPDEELVAWDKQIMEMDAAASLEVWDKALGHPLPEERHLPPFEINRAEARWIYLKMTIAGIISMIGVGLLLTGVLLKPRARKRPVKSRKTASAA